LNHLYTTLYQISYSQKAVVTKFAGHAFININIARL